MISPPPPHLRHNSVSVGYQKTRTPQVPLNARRPPLMYLLKTES